MWFQLAIGFVAFSSVLCAPTDTCDVGLEIFNCMYKTKYSMDDNHQFDIFIPDEKGLDKMCKDTFAMTKCVTEAVIDCPRVPDNPILALYPEVYELLKKLCNKPPSAFRKDYLKQSKCLNAKKDMYESTCQDLLSPPHYKPDEQDCKAFEAKTKACYDKVQGACGDEALSVAKQMYSPYTNMYARPCGSGF